MSSRNQHTRFQVFADELTGDSRDRPLRYEIENKISVFFDDINEKRWTSVKSYFSDDARVIFGFRSPNQIIDKDVDLVIERIREKADGMRRVTVPTLVLVDRGRVTCFLTNLWIDIDERDDDATLDVVEARHAVWRNARGGYHRPGRRVQIQARGVSDYDSAGDKTKGDRGGFRIFGAENEKERVLYVVESDE